MSKRLEFSRGMRALVLAVIACGATAGIAADAEATPTVAQILDRVMAARGGATAWSRVLSMGWTGRIDGGEGKPAVPFLMYFQRPNATHFEVLVQNQRAVHVFDGKHGWKMTPGGELGIQVQDYTPEEVTAALDACGLDGPLAGAEAKGVKVAFDGAEMLGSRKVWKLKVTLPSGAMQTHWIDASDYHDLRYDRVTRDRTGRSGVISVYLNNYQTIEGLTLPLEIVTRGSGGPGSNTMVIEKIAFNPVMQANTFQRPDIPGVRHRGVTINTAEAQQGAAPRH